MNDFKKEIIKNLKKSWQKIVIDDIDTKYRSNGLDLLKNNYNVGRLGIALVTKKFAEPKALFGGYVVSNISEGAIVSYLNQLRLSYKSFFHEKHYFGFSSLYYKSNLFFDEGTFSFYEEDNLEKKCEDIILNIKKLYITVIDNFVNCKIATIQDVFDCPKNYGRPTATLLAVCLINNKPEMIDELVQRARKKKLYDSLLLTNDAINKIKIGAFR